MERARVLVSTLVFASVMLGGAAAFADDEGLRLAWSAPPGCPNGDDVKAATLRSVDRGKMLSGTLLADASVEQLTPSSWRVRLKTQRGDNAGEREIEGPTCAGVADATAVILALALVPPTTLEAPPPPEEPEKPKEPEAATASKEPAEPESHHLAAGVAYAANLGGLPKVGAGGAVTLAWTPGRLRIEAEGKLFGGQGDNVSGRPEGADFYAKGLGGRACFAVVARSSFDVAPCLGIGAEIMIAHGRKSDHDDRKTEVWASFTGGALGRVFLTKWLAMRARIEAVVPVLPPDFVVEVGGEGQRSVFRPSAIGGAGTFGAEVLFL